jgi:hypothetical protein
MHLPDSQTLAPVNGAIDYVQRKFDNSLAHKTKYRGVPTKDLEEEWRSLFRCEDN